MSQRSEKERYPLNQSPLFRLRSRQRLAELFSLNRVTLDRLCSLPPYRSFTVLNKKGKQRAIQQPGRHLLPIHERMKRLLGRIEPPPFLFCPVKGRSYVGNAKAHIGADEVRTVDVREYFTSTPRRRVFWFFHHVMECSEDVAAALAQLLTANGHLPTGSPVSPIMSFYAFYDMWALVAQVAGEHGCEITVYMDDLTVSGRSVPESVMWKIRQAIHRFGLRYHKERKFTGGRAEVTGLVLRDGKVLVPNRQRKRAHELASEVRAEEDPIRRDQLQSVLAGLLGQRRQVEGAKS